jgi:alkenylglycerophosphocholine/alkenylglycerophosphoethanolamine hydrolase
VGAVLFGLSDTLIAIDRFHAPFPGARYAIILLYWAGQAGIAASARPAPRSRANPSEVRAR